MILKAEMSYEEINAAYYKSYEYETKKNYRKAVKALSEVYKNYAHTYTVNYRLGWLYYLNGNFKNAISHLDNSLISIPSSVEVQNVKTLVFVAQGDWGNVEENSLKTIKIDHYNVTANYWYSFSLRQLDKAALAEKVDRKMLEILPTSVSFLAELSWNLYMQDELDEAKLTLSSVFTLDPDNESATILHEEIYNK